MLWRLLLHHYTLTHEEGEDDDDEKKKKEKKKELRTKIAEYFTDDVAAIASLLPPRYFPSASFRLPPPHPPHSWPIITHTHTHTSRRGKIRNGCARLYPPVLTLVIAGALSVTSGQIHPRDFSWF